MEKKCSEAAGENQITPPMARITSEMTETGQQSPGPDNSADCDACYALMGDLIGDVIHELRGPLGTMLTSVHLVEARMNHADPATRKGLERIRRSIDRCDSVIGKLQDYSRSAPLRAEPTGLDQWLRAAVHAYRPARDIALAFDSGLGEERFLIDREKLGRAIVAILDNAVLAAAEHEERGQISVRTTIQCAHLEIGISDNGQGISEEYRDRVFDPFFSVRRGGVGLGLAIARRFVEMHGGKIAVDNPPGGGTSFRILLPLERVGMKAG